MENIVPQHQTYAIVANKFLADDKRLRKTVRRGLLRIFEVHAIVRSIAKKPLERRQIRGRRDNEDVPDPRQHEHADGIIHHGLVVNGQELLTHTLGDRIQPRAGAAGEHNAFHQKISIQ